MLSAIQSVDRKLIEVGRVLRLSPPDRAADHLAAVMPVWIASLRSGLASGSCSWSRPN